MPTCAPRARIVPGGRYDDIDLVLVRENLEGLYVGFEHYIPIDGDPHAVAISSGVNTRAGSRRHRRVRVRLRGEARPEESHDRPQGERPQGADRHLPRDGARRREAVRRPRSQVDDRIVDACAMQLVLNPWQFDVIVPPISSATSCPTRSRAWSAGSAWRPGANIGEGAAIFEAVHGSAPDIAGKGIANPLALLLAAGDDARSRRQAGPAAPAARARSTRRCARTTCAPAISAARRRPRNLLRRSSGGSSEGRVTSGGTKPPLHFTSRPFHRGRIRPSARGSTSPRRASAHRRRTGRSPAAPPATRADRARPAP